MSSTAERAGAAAAGGGDVVLDPPEREVEPKISSSKSVLDFAGGAGCPFVGVEVEMISSPSRSPSWFFVDPTGFLSLTETFVRNSSIQEGSALTNTHDSRFQFWWRHLLQNTNTQISEVEQAGEFYGTLLKFELRTSRVLGKEIPDSLLFCRRGRAASRDLGQSSKDELSDELVCVRGIQYRKNEIN